MRARLLVLLPALAAIAAPAAAQYPADAVALRWTGAAGNAAGPFCFGFQCAPDSTTASPGEQASLLLRGDPGAAYFVAVSLSASACIPIPGVAHALALDPPLYVVLAGTLDQFSPILSCPSGVKTIQVDLPASLIPGTSFAVQAIVLPASLYAPPSLTQAIVIAIV